MYVMTLAPPGLLAPSSLGGGPMSVPCAMVSSSMLSSAPFMFLLY